MKMATLQNLSAYTLLESPTRILDLLKTAKNKGYEAVGLTDINVTYGLVNFYELAQKVGIKPLLGMQIRINGLIDSAEKYDLIVIAKNDQGYRNLLRLSSAINLLTNNGENDRILALSELKKYLEELVIITPANLHSELVMLFQRQEKLGSDYLRAIKKIIPQSSSLYLGVYANESARNYINYVKSLSTQFKLPLVAVEDGQYLEPQQQFLRKSLTAIKNGEKLQDVVALAKQKGSHYMLSSVELKEKYQNFGLEEAIENTWEIAQACEAKVVFKKPVLPKYQQNKFPTSKEYLFNLAKKGLIRRFKNGQVPVDYRKRLNYELAIIDKMGFDDYFLIVWDVMNYCHQEKITTGPGRGSACGSLVSYALKITEVDPLEYNLLFERFLNPARHEMPDIDLDIPDNRRDDVIKYMYHKYGVDHAAQILTFGTLAAKQALRDTGRIFGFSDVEINKWANAVPSSKGKIILNEAYENSRELRLLVNSTKENRLLFQTARAIEGLPRHYSVHAAGLVISDKSIAEISALQAGPLDIEVTQQTKKYVESLGLLKIDFLGLRNLTILGDTLNLINQQGTHLDPHKIPLNDAKTLQLFDEGKTDAIFQFESNGIKRVLRSLHPDNFEDLVAVNALYRPGPMNNIDTFIARKKGQERIQYPDSSLEKILAPTYGVLVYQEQVMQTAQVLAGFSLGEADILRRAMSKKEPDVIARQRDKFIQGTVKNGHPRLVGERVYKYIEQFANYGFNRSHAVAYTKIAFWLAYLKVHFPLEFYTAILNSSGAGKAQSYIMQAQEAGIKFSTPDINQSQKNYTIKEGKILVGLRAIKGLRIDFVNQIVNLKRPFTSFSDFLRKIDLKFLKVELIQILIKAGCFDNLHSNRNELLENCADFVDIIKLTGKNVSLSEGLGGVPIKKAPAPSNTEKAAMEEEVLGFSTTTTPLVAVQKYAQKFNAHALNSFNANESGIGVGKLIRIKKIKTKKGEEMAFATFADTTGNAEFTIFPEVYKKVESYLKEGQIYILGIKVQNDRFDPNKKQYLLTNLRKVQFKE